MRGRWSDGPRFLAQFPALETWEQRVKKIGHGQPQDMDASEALAIALEAETATPEAVDSQDPQALALGMSVEVRPEGEGGDPSVAGTVRYADRETIAVLREESRVGRVCVHFPRVGYRVTVA